MPDRWIHERFEKFQTKIAAEQQREQWDHKAKASYDAQFDALKARVDEDIKTYNQLFSKNKECAATFQPEYRGGFAAACSARGKTVSVEKTNSPVIKIYRGGDFAIPPEKSDMLEIVTDDHGNIRYKHGKDLLGGVSDASQIILDPVLC